MKLETSDDGTRSLKSEGKLIEVIPVITDATGPPP